MKLATCRSCGASIVWVVTSNLKKMPVDADPVALPHGFRLTEEDDDDAGAPIATFVAAVPAGERVWQSHFATCPNATQHRRTT